ncbi:MAG: DUF1127 domain-containing protein [Alphaproteobacteria bacterium]|nr:DUF1127 domain-containing protein [Alphaproteobacteria bacterium]
MTMKHSNPALVGGVGGSLSDAILALVAGAVETLWTWQNRADTRASLSTLDRRLMADIGVTEDMVKDEIAKPFWRA